MPKVELLAQICDKSLIFMDLCSSVLKIDCGAPIGRRDEAAIHVGIAAFLLSALLTVTPAGAQAADLPEAATAVVGSAETQSVYAIGAGIGLISNSAVPASVVGVGALGTVTPGISVPSMVFAIERRWGPQSWFVGTASAGYTSSQYVSLGYSLGGYTILSGKSDVYAVSASLGSRYVHNPGSLVEISSYLLATAGRTETSHTSSDALPTPSGETSSYYSNLLGGAVGVVFDARLTANLALRLSTSVLEATHVSSSSTYTPTGQKPDPATSSATTFGFHLNPVIGLRIRL